LAAPYIKASAAINLTFAKDAAAAEMTVGWNLTAMIFIEVKTDEFHMQLTVGTRMIISFRRLGSFGIPEYFSGIWDFIVKLATF
jgi:hypothetical protein